MTRAKFGSIAFATVVTGLLWSAYGGSPPSTRPAFHPAVAHVGSGLPQPNPNGVREWKDYDQMHDYFVDGFVNSEGFGRDRMPTPREMARWSTLYIEGVNYAIGNIQLISTRQEAEPFAYQTAGDASMRATRDAVHRPLKAAEGNALKQLKAGKDAVLVANDNKPMIVGAVRASESCLDCHQAKKGELLGAFTYPLVPVDEPQIAQKRVATTRPSKSSAR